MLASKKEDVELVRALVGGHGVDVNLQNEVKNYCSQVQYLNMFFIAQFVLPLR